MREGGCSHQLAAAWRAPPRRDLPGLCNYYPVHLDPSLGPHHNHQRANLMIVHRTPAEFKQAPAAIGRAQHTCSTTRTQRSSCATAGPSGTPCRGAAAGRSGGPGRASRAAPAAASAPCASRPAGSPARWRLDGGGRPERHTGKQVAGTQGCGGELQRRAMAGARRAVWHTACVCLHDISHVSDCCNGNSVTCKTASSPMVVRITVRQPAPPPPRIPPWAPCLPQPTPLTVRCAGCAQPLHGPAGRPTRPAAAAARAAPLPPRAASAARVHASARCGRPRTSAI